MSATTQAFGLEREVARQLDRARGCRPDELLRRAALSDSAAAEYLSNEALVALIRDAVRDSDNDTAWRLMEIVRRRTESYVAYAAALIRNEDGRIDCIREILTAMFEALLDLTPSESFWEARFWVCLQRRASNIVRKQMHRVTTELQPYEPEDDGRDSVIDREPDQRAEAEFEKLELRDALEKLKPDEYEAVVLFHCHRMPQGEIARRLGISDRTVRNLLHRGERRLRAWYGIET